MLRKYPGLTIVGGLAMAFAIWVGAVVFHIVSLVGNPTLPLPGGDRIVQIRNWDVSENRAEYRIASEYLLWRQALTVVTDLGAFREFNRNLVATVGDARPVMVAEITASAFRIAPDRPLLGRVLTAADERAGAAPVIVIGYDIWKNRFGSDPGILGRSVQLGDAYATVVGVMPEDYEFPRYHDVWVPLRTDLLDQSPRAGADIRVFGRLAPGASLETAQAELTTLGKRLATEFPATHEHLEPKVGPYAKMFSGSNMETPWLMFSMNLFAVMFIALVCSNVALLLFARAATRESEIVVRSALGASRGRIVMQLFTEALVLGGVAAVVGLWAANFGLQWWGTPFLEENFGRLPFWYDLSLSPITVLYALVLTLMAAAIAGVLPGLKVTRGLGSRLKQGTAGGGGLRFGGVWTAVIVTQVAFTVAFPVVLYVERWELRRIQSFDVGFAAEHFLGVKVEMDHPDGSGAKVDSVAASARGERYGAALERLRQRLVAEPGVLGVTFVDQMPREWHIERRIEIDDPYATAVLAKEAAEKDKTPPLRGDGARTPVNEVSLAYIDPSYFTVLQTPILAGRGFNEGDHAPNGRAVIVDQAFVDRMLQGRNAIGQRMRFAPRKNRDGTLSEEPRPWYEIVGVVKELGMASAWEQHRAAGVYFPTNLKNVGELSMMVRAQGDPMALASRVREIAIAVDPTLRISNLLRVDEISNGIEWVLKLWIRVSSLLTAIALLLSLAGIYAVLSFTVSRRTREIGVRVALGASRQRLVAAIFRKPLTQVSLGIVGGAILIGMIAFAFTGGLSFADIARLLAYAALMFGVCMLACIVPTRRALGVEPMEALRAE